MVLGSGLLSHPLLLNLRWWPICASVLGVVLSFDILQYTQCCAWTQVLKPGSLLPAARPPWHCFFGHVMSCCSVHITAYSAHMPGVVRQLLILFACYLDFFLFSSPVSQVFLQFLAFRNACKSPKGHFTSWAGMSLCGTIWPSLSNSIVMALPRSKRHVRIILDLVFRR